MPNTLASRRERDWGGRRDALWEELFPTEQARIIQLLVERIDVNVDGISIRLRTEGIASVIGELRPNMLKAA